MVLDIACIFCVTVVCQLHNLGGMFVECLCNVYIMHCYTKCCLKACISVSCDVVVWGPDLDRGLGQPKGMSWLLGHMGVVSNIFTSHFSLYCLYFSISIHYPHIFLSICDFIIKFLVS